MPPSGVSTLQFEDAVTVCVKHTPGFTSRAIKLSSLVRSIRLMHGVRVAILIASEEPPTDLVGGDLRIQHVALPLGAGLSAGRNELVRRAHTPYVMIMDDDVELLDNSSLPMLLAALHANPTAAVAGGCYAGNEAEPHCYNIRFSPSEDGSVVHAQRVHNFLGSQCQQVHLTHNLFMARTSILRRFPYDPRQKVYEHETFFYQLFLNSQPVIACPSAVALHNNAQIISDSVPGEDPYEWQSLRNSKGGVRADAGIPFMHLLCKNFPEVRRFITPINWWHCDRREFCSPHYDAEFAFDGRSCLPMPWSEGDDSSAVTRPLVPPYANQRHIVPGCSHSCTPLPKVPLVVIVLTESENVKSRAWQRATWLNFRWHASHLRGPTGQAVTRDGDEPVPWRK